MPGETINCLCASGMNAVVNAARASSLGDGDIFIAGASCFGGAGRPDGPALVINHDRHTECLPASGSFPLALDLDSNLLERLPGIGI